MQIGKAASRVPLERIHIRRHSLRIVDRILLIWDSVSKQCAWHKTLVIVIEVHCVVVGRVFDNFETKADTFLVVSKHVIWALYIVKELLPIRKWGNFVIRNESWGCL